MTYIGAGIDADGDLVVLLSPVEDDVTHSWWAIWRDKDGKIRLGKVSPVGLEILPDHPVDRMATSPVEFLQGVERSRKEAQDRTALRLIEDRER